MNQNHYHVLGLASTATAQEIKVAYKRLAMQYHPDRHKGNTQYEEQFKAVSVAYRVLSDPGRRATYDYQLELQTQRAEQQRRQQQYRAQGQHVYGVPMPPPSEPLRTRRPAGTTERYYRTIPRQRPRFTSRDYWLTAGMFLLLALFIISVKITMDHISAVSNYEDGLRAYTRREWSAAHSFMTEALHFKPAYPAARQRRAEIEQYVYHDYAEASADYRTALEKIGAKPYAGPIWARLGQCELILGQNKEAEHSLTQALQLDTTLSNAYLMRGEVRLFEQRQYAEAIADFSAGLRQQAALGWSPNIKGLTYRGLAYFKQGKLAAARADYRQVLLLTPNNGQIHFLLGRLAQKEGNPVAACEFFRRSIRLGYLYAAEAEQQACQ